MESILVVDDESGSLKLLTGILTAEGYRVCPADSAALGLASLEAQLPDLILADVRMPSMDGFDFCRRLKALPGTSAIPLIFISASTDATACVEGLALGAVDYVTKPFRREELLARVRTHLELSQLRGSLEIQVSRRTAQLHAAVDRLQREIAERTQAEEALRESEERFRHMADTAPVLIWVSGADKLCTFFNKGWLNFTGRSLEQEIGNGWAENVHQDDLDRCQSTYSEAFDARRSFRMEYRLRRSDGEYRWVVDEGVPRIQPGGQFLGYVGSCIDITDIRQVKEEALARERVESLRVLAGGIAHDFTNLMSGILTTTELADMAITTGASPAEEIRTIQSVARQAVEIARELMIYAGQDKGRFEQLNLSQLVEGMAEILKTSISRQSQLKYDLPRNLPAIWANPTHIRQVVMNLVINASEAMGEDGGVISIGASRGVDPRGPDRTPAETPNFLRLEVSDTGCGMTEDELTRIFDPFFTTKGSGHGLGLSVVQGIVNSHGGVINVISNPGQGTTFEIFLPCARISAGNTPASVHAA